MTREAVITNAARDHVVDNPGVSTEEIWQHISKDRKDLEDELGPEGMPTEAELRNLLDGDSSFEESEDDKWVVETHDVR